MKITYWKVVGVVVDLSSTIRLKPRCGYRLPLSNIVTALSVGEIDDLPTNRDVVLFWRNGDAFCQKAVVRS